jgi:hypothetical protein
LTNERSLAEEVTLRKNQKGDLEIKITCARLPNVPHSLAYQDILESTL